MESKAKVKKSKLLLAAFIVGLLYVLCVFAPLIKKTDTGATACLALAVWGNVPHLLSTLASFSFAKLTFVASVKALVAYVCVLLLTLYFAIAPVGVIAGFVFNCIGWARQAKGSVLVASIGYILSLNPVSALLCFIYLSR